MRLWYYARPNQMVEHEFVDDVAITRAWTKQGAIKKFGEFYKDVYPSKVDKVEPRKYSCKVQVLTDY